MRIFECECSGRRRIIRLLRQWVDNVSGCLREKNLTERKADEIAYDKNAWRDFVRRSCLGLCA